MKKHHYVLLAVLLAALSACAVNTEQGVNAEEVAEANARLGIDFMNKGKNEQAMERLERALRYQPEHVDANWAIAIVHQRLGETEQADEHYQRAIDGQARPQIQNGYAVFLCENGKTEQALEYFEEAADNPRYPSPADALANAGLCLERSGQPAAAEEYYQRALKADSRHVPALSHMARLTFSRGEHMRTRAFLQRLDGESALTDDLLLLAARTELLLEDRSAAESYLRRYNANHPGAERTLSELQRQAYE